MTSELPICRGVTLASAMTMDLLPNLCTHVGYKPMMTAIGIFCKISLRINASCRNSFKHSEGDNRQDQKFFATTLITDKEPELTSFNIADITRIQEVTLIYAPVQHPQT